MCVCCHSWHTAQCSQIRLEDVCVCVVTAGILPIVEEEEAEAEEDEGLTTILENEEEGWCGCVCCTWLYMEL